MKTRTEVLQGPCARISAMVMAVLLARFAALAQPDLRGYNGAYAFDVQESAVNWGDSITLQFAVANYGNAAAVAFKVGLYLSADTTIGDANDYLFQSVNFNNGMNAGYYGYLSYTAITLPSINPLPGQPTTVYVGMVVDVDNQVSESNEGNDKNLGGGIDRDDTPVTITPPQPAIAVTDSVSPGNDRAVAFADVADDGPGNARGVETVTVINKGKGTLTMNSLALSGSSAFSIVDIASSTQHYIQPNSLPRALGKNSTETWVITLQFDPATNGAASGTFTINSDDPTTPALAVSLTGNGLPVPKIGITTLEALETDFGSVVQDGEGGFQSTRTISLKNTGTGPLTVNQNGISLLTGTQFSVVSVTSTTQGAIDLATCSTTIAARGAEIWNVVVRFDPTTPGELNDGLRVASNDPNQPLFTASLRGKGLSPMQLQVKDAAGTSNIVAVAFPGVHADGVSKEQATTIITLKNSGDAPLTVSSNGMTFTTGSHFRLGGIISDAVGTVDLTTGPKQIAGGSSETWTVALIFDPATCGALNDRLSIASDDLASPSLTVALSGQGVVCPALAVTDSVAPTNDLTMPFGSLLNDGPGGTDAHQTVTLTDIGAEPLVVAQNGLSLSGGPGFSVVSVMSSTRGAVDVSSVNPPDRTITPAQNETWTVSLVFDPTVNGPSTGTLAISSNDTNQPLVQVSLNATGATPAITLTTPALPLNVSAGSVFNFAWQYSSPGTNTTLALYLDTDANPDTGLIPIATGVPAPSAGAVYSWRVDPALADSSYFVYATITDGSVTRGAYAPGTLRIDPVGAFQVRSSREVTSADYGYEYEYNGQLYHGVTHLASGDNTVTVSNALPGGGTATFQFAVNRVPSLIHTETVKHDQLNRVQEVKNGNGIVTRLIYDQMGRVIRRESDNSAVVEFTYDVLGRRTSMTDYTGTTFYEWDDLSRLTAVMTSKNAVEADSDDLPLRYEYDLAGRQTAIVYPGGERIQYTYDDAGRMLTVNNVTRSLLFTYAYNPTNGLLTKLSRPNGIDTLYSYDGMGRVTTLHHQRTDGTLVADFSYGLDAAGKATNFVTTLPDGITKREQYAYDRFDRLVQAIYADNGVIDANSRRVDYTYDGNGNRLTMTTTSNSVVTQALTYHYGNENRLLSITDQSGATVAQFGYDAAGNCIQKITPEKTTFYSFDERNLLTSVVDGTNQVVFAYNGDGQRIGKTVNGVPTTFVVDANRKVFQTVQERNAAGTVAASYILAGRRLGTFAGASADFELTDRIGSVRLISDTTGAITDSYAHDVFGASSLLAGNSAAFTFSGERLDPETGMIFLRARCYEPDTGRFGSKDPLGLQAGPNGYAYCGSDPVNHTDPMGLDSDTTGLDFAIGLARTLAEPVCWASDAASLIGSFVPGNDASTFTPLSQLGQSQVARIAEGIQSGLSLDQSVNGVVAQDFMTGFSRGMGAVATFGLSSVAETSWQLGTAIQNRDYEGMGAAVGSLGLSFLEAGNSEIRSVWRNNGRFAETGSAGAEFRIEPWKGWESSPLGETLSVAWDGFGGAASPISGALPVGGVLLDKAAQLVGSNLSDIRGAMYDPVSGQFVFLGTDGAAGVKDINLDYLYTALQAVYGSAVPPFVTLDPPATIRGGWNDLGNGDGVFEPGETGGFMLHYTPRWSGEDHELRIGFRTGGTSYTIVIDAVVVTNIIAGGQHLMAAKFNRWDGPTPSGVTWVEPTGRGIWINGIYCGTSISAGPDGQDTFYPILLQNSGTQNHVIEGLSVRSDRQHRKFGGRVENTKLGWVMLEADRVMKCLSVGKDNLTGAAYNSSTISVSGYQNMAQRGGAGNIRMWFTPNEMTLKRHLDPETGRAIVVFDQASVALNTESFMMGLPQPAQARAFADHFTANYDAFAALSFPCVDPSDPTGTAIINVKIFDMLKDAMRAVSLARFFRDNNVPVDMWWLNSWEPQIAYSPKSTPTAYNEEGGYIIYGGVQVNKPNAYVPSASAKSVADVVQSSRPSVPADASADIQQQVWSAGTAEGALKAVAANTTAEPQDGNIRLAEVDLNFASPGALPLQFTRYYQSSWLGRAAMGPGWRDTPFVLEFERPSWFDENSLMWNGTNTVWTDSRKDTRLRSGTVRVVDLRSGATLDFLSSLVLGYAVDNIGNTVITLSGLDTNGLPTFTPGQRQSGATLTQVTDTLSYLFTTPDGIQITFDSEGRLLQTKDRNGMAQTYAYNSSSYLTNITDAAGQKFTLTYDTNLWRVLSIAGPASEQVNYTYATNGPTNGCLVRATHVRSGGYVSYQYNTNCQLVGKTLYNGQNVLQAQPDLKGRPNVAADVRNNTVEQAFWQDSSGSVRSTEINDPLIRDPSFQSWRRDFDRDGRPLVVSDATGAETYFGYDEGSLAPNYIDLPIAGRPTITIQRNESGQPTRISDPGNLGAQDVSAIYDATTKLLRYTTNEAGLATELLYNTNKSIVHIRRQIGGQIAKTSFDYYTNGALRTKTNALGITTVTYYRDSLARATNVVDATGVSISYQYDTLGRLWKVHDPRLNSAVEYIYDNFDRVIEIRYPVGSVFYNYDPVKGWLVSQTDLLGRVTRYVRHEQTGDILQTIDEVAGGSNRVTAMTYNRYGQLATLTPSDANTISFNYDDLGRALGSSEMDARAPGAPKVIVSDRAKDGVPTTATSHVFTWGAPDSDTGIAGYSYALDQIPETNMLTGASATVNSVSVGSHTFRVRAKGNNGLWGDAGVFNLVVEKLGDPGYLTNLSVLPDRNTQMILHGSADARYILQRATNLTESGVLWSDVVTNNTDAQGRLIFRDPRSTNFEQKYYRSRTP